MTAARRPKKPPAARRKLIPPDDQQHEWDRLYGLPVLRGEIRVCKLTMLAVERHYRDLQTAHKRGFVFSAQAAQRRDPQRGEQSRKELASKIASALLDSRT